MKSFKQECCLLAVAAALAFPTLVSAAVITPTSYAYTGGTPPGETSFSFYDDPGLTKLTDGSVGTTTPSDGSWVGWQHSDSGAAQITFNFGAMVTITNVALNFLRQDAANTQLPESVTIGGMNFPTTNFASDNTEGFVGYSGSWTGSSLLVTLNHTTAHWVFVNEAQFTSAPIGVSVPEPETLMLFGLGIVGLGLTRRRAA